MLCAYMHPPGDPGFEQLRARGRGLPGAPALGPRPRPVGLAGRRPAAGHLPPRARRHLARARLQEQPALGLLLRPFWPMRLVTTVHGWVKQTRRTPLYYAHRPALPAPLRAGDLRLGGPATSGAWPAGCRPDRCVLIENGIDTEQFRRGTSDAEAEEAARHPARLLSSGPSAGSPPRRASTC